MRAKGQGYSLIELMLVVLVAGILAGIAYPSYVNAMRRGERAQVKAHLLQLMQQQERVHTQTGSYIAFDITSTDATSKLFKAYSGSTAATSAYEIKGQACSNETLQTCVQLTATPGSAKVNSAFRDPDCGVLSLNSVGTKTSATGSAKCW